MEKERVRIAKPKIIEPKYIAGFICPSLKEKKKKEKIKKKGLNYSPESNSFYL